MRDACYERSPLGFILFSDAQLLLVFIAGLPAATRFWAQKRGKTLSANPPRGMWASQF